MPLGPTEQCLNVDQVADAAAGKLDGMKASHLKDCRDCHDQVRTYQLLEETDFTDATHGVDISDFIRVPVGKELYVVLFNRGNAVELSEIDPDSVEVAGVINGKVKAIEPLDPKQFNAEEAVAIHFETFKLNVPESGELEDYLCLEAKTKTGRFRKRRMVHLIDEAKMQAAEPAGIAIVPASEFSFSLKPGDHAVTVNLPGITATTPPPTPLFAGNPTRYG